MTRGRNRPLRSALLRMATVVASAMVAFIAAAQTAKPPGRSHISEVLSKAPEKARALHNPMTGDPDAATAGGKLFEQHCAECHGPKAGGSRRAPSLLTPELQSAAPGAIFWVLTNGVVRHGMPVWSKLPEPRRWQIVTFLQSLNSQGRERQAAPSSESAAPASN